MMPASENNSRPAAENNRTETNFLNSIYSIDLKARFPTEPKQEKVATGNRVQPMIYTGDDQPALAPDQRPSAPDQLRMASADARFRPNGEGYDLNFENTPVELVAKAVLGDILGVGYIIDPRVQGTISLSSGRPVSKSDAVFVLENALRLSGAALVRSNGGYRLVPQGDAVGAGELDAADRTEPGYGVSVVPLRYVSAQTLLKLVDSFGTKPGMVRADASRNVILIQGSGSERRNAIDLVVGFDADWMRGQSVGIFPIQNSSPEPIIAELEKIMDSGEGGIGQSVVKLQTIERMNAVLAVTKKPDLLHRIETWVRRLDNADTGRSGVYIYRLKYGEARAIARVLNDIFGGGGGSGSSLDSAPSQIAPGSGILTSSSGTNRGSAGSTGHGLSAFTTASQRLAAAGDGESRGGQGAASQPGQFDMRGGGLFGPPGAGALGGGAPMVQGVRITADAANNTLYIYANQENYRIIERTLRQVDRPQLQVGIETTVAEVTLNDELSYGVQFFITSKNLGLPANKGSALNASDPPSLASQALNGAISRAFPGFNFLIGPELKPSMILDALHTITDTKILSNPSVVVLDNEVATLQVGDDVPVQTGSATVLTTNNTVVNTIDYRSTGIILRVVPRINANGNVRLEIEQEISEAPQTATSLTPTFSQRRVRSVVVVASGQTVLLAGLVKEVRSGTRGGIPILDQIPGLGAAFSHNDQTGTRTELIIFIRPQIIRDGRDAQFLAEELRSKLRSTLILPVKN
jgi:general secretion pathway protein D